MSTSRTTITVKRATHVLDAERLKTKYTGLSFAVDTDALVKCRCTTHDRWSCGKLQHRASKLLDTLEMLIKHAPRNQERCQVLARNTCIKLFMREYGLQVTRWLELLAKLSMERSTGQYARYIEGMVQTGLIREKYRRAILSRAVQRICIDAEDDERVLLLLMDVNKEWQRVMNAHDELLYGAFAGLVGPTIDLGRPFCVESLADIESLMDFHTALRSDLPTLVQRWRDL